VFVGESPMLQKNPTKTLYGENMVDNQELIFIVITD
jgi:hypothetical protein